MRKKGIALLAALLLALLAGSGANGADLTLGETAYKVYGELQIITAQTSIYIEEA